MANIYCSSTKYAAVTAWAASTAYSLGAIRRQLATPTVGNERCFRVTTAGTSGGTEPTWVITANGTTTDGTVTWTECTGQAIFNGDGGGSAWAAPHARTYTAGNFAAAGDDVIVGSDHAELQTGSTLTYPTTMAGTQAACIRFICCDVANVPPTTLATTATVGTNGALNIAFSMPAAYFYGITFNAGTTTASASLNIGNSSAGAVASTITFDTCVLKLNNTNTASRINSGAAAGTNSRGMKIKYINCDFVFGNASQKILFGNAKSDFIGGTIAATGTNPTAPAMSVITGSAATVSMNGTDLSVLSAPMFDNAANTSYFDVTLANCNNDAMQTSEPARVTSFDGKAYNSGTSTNNERFIYNNSNNLTVPSSEAALSGGASDGTNAYSFKLVPTANNDKVIPLETIEFRAWNDNIGASKTATLELYCASGVTDQQIWMEVEYYNSTSTTKSTRAKTISNTTLLIPGATGTALTSSSGSWSGTGITGGVSRKLAVTFTPQLKGYVIARVYANKNLASNVYIDPMLVIS